MISKHYYFKLINEEVRKYFERNKLIDTSASFKGRGSPQISRFKKDKE